MNYLQAAVDKLNLDGMYYTPKKINKMIETERNNVIIGNPPIKLIQYDAISPDGFSISREEYYSSILEAKKAINNFAKRYEMQGYYSTIVNGERIQIPISELSYYCEIVEI